MAWLQESLLQKLSPQIGHLLSDASNPDKYKDNLIKLEIYYEELNFQDMTEIPSYPVSEDYSILVQFRHVDAMYLRVNSKIHCLSIVYYCLSIYTVQFIHH